MSNFAEMNSFVIKHADSKYFDADIKLYKKHFPNSKLNAELDKAPDFMKKQLDERILTELLQNQDSCIDCIWENRGFIRDENKKVTPLKPVKPKAVKKEVKNAPVVPGNSEIIKASFLKVDLKKAKYNVLKQLIFDLNLQSQCEDQKKETYLKELTAYQNEMQVNSINTEPKKKEAPE